MITLEYDDLQWDSCSIENQDPETWTMFLSHSAFDGCQTFQTDDACFSAYVPILYFARQLKMFCREFERGALQFTFAAPSETWKLTFVRRGEMIEVDEWSVDPQFSGQRTYVSLEELSKCADKYYDEVYYLCCRKVPPLRTNLYVQSWLAPDAQV